jgi:glycerophosphoryl diester phosphodiesterase
MVLANELELDVNVWTVNNPMDIKAMAELGVSSIITDDPVTALLLVG